MKHSKPKHEASSLKICFPLEPDESGYPPVKSESLWCTLTKRKTYIVDNVPFFVRDVSLGDEIAAKKSDELLRYFAMVHPSKNSTVRVLFKKPSRADFIMKKISDFGCGFELMPKLSLLAVNMPPKARIADTLSFLDKEVKDGNIGIEESAVRYQ